MAQKFTRRFLMGSMLAGIASPIFANAPKTSLRPVPRPLSVRKLADKGPETLIDAARLHGDVGFAVADASTGALLEDHNGDLGLPPASVTKAVTALYALDVLGAEHRFQTRVMASGPIKEGVLEGDLILVGGADPTLDTDDLATLAAKLAAAGLRSVTGRFLVYGGALPFVRAIDPGQPVHVGYSPAISGICLNFNRVYFDWKQTANGVQVSMEARSEHVRPPVKVARMSLSDRQGPVYAYDGLHGVDDWSVARHVLKKDGGRWLPMRQPELYAGEAFRWLAKTHGVNLPAPAKTSSQPSGQTLARHDSEPLAEILRGMLKYSTNVTAEMVGLSATLARGNYVAHLRASGREMAKWAAQELGMGHAKFVDHSGLGDASRLNAAELALALVRAQRKSTLQPLLKEITLRTEDGKPDKGHPIKVRAKTGTLNFVSGLAGYAASPDGREMAFAIFSADTETREGLARHERERPKGARSWNRRAKTLQQRLIERWAKLYAS